MTAAEKTIKRIYLARLRSTSTCSTAQKVKALRFLAKLNAKYG